MGIKAGSTSVAMPRDVATRHATMGKEEKTTRHKNGIICAIRGKVE